MEFRTPIPEYTSPLRIDHHTPLLTMGSCFANVMGSKLKTHKFNIKVNPFGVLFNPLSIFKVLEASADKNVKAFENSFILNNGIWHNYHLHSDFSASEKHLLQQKISETLSDVKEYLSRTHVLTITFGTAFLYRLIDTEEAVANCHKIPASHFRKELIKTEEITNGFEILQKRLTRLNPSLKIILTVSPVRHIKDGMELNAVSKAILRSACHFIQEQYSNVEYFPGYEIMMDDLRDYRFYKEDMIHPSAVAEEYIWEKFLLRFTDKKTQDLTNEWASLYKAINHRPFHPESENHQKFIRETIRRVKEFRSVIDVESELQELESRLLS